MGGGELSAICMLYATFLLDTIVLLEGCTHGAVQQVRKDLEDVANLLRNAKLGVFGVMGSILISYPVLEIWDV